MFGTTPRATENTDKRQRLHSGAPFWLLNSGLDELEHSSDANAFAQNLVAPVDVAIVGAGVTGALLADRFTAAGLTVAVFDRRAASYGSTAASTALLLYEVDVELVPLIKMIGDADAVRAYQLGITAIAQLEKLSAQLGGCGFASRSSVYLASRRRHARSLKAEYEARARAGLPVTWLERDQVHAEYGFDAHGALHTTVAGELDPVQLTRALLRRAMTRGALYLPRTTVHSVVRGNARTDLTTSRGAFPADRVVYAAGYEVPDALRAHRVALHSSYALATEPVEHFGQWNDGSLVWETARPYSYMRTTPDSRILIGGGDVPFRDADWRDRLMPDKTRRLEKRLHQLVRDVDTTTAYAWSGTFGETPDGLPYIGTCDGEPDIAYALGYGGNGITFSVMAADVLTDWAFGRDNADARIFRLSR